MFFKVSERYLLILILALTYLFLCGCNSNIQINEREPYVEARVLKIISSVALKDEVNNTDEQTAKILVKILNGVNKDEKSVIKQELFSEKGHISIPVEGDIVILSDKITKDGNFEPQIVDFKRSNTTIVAIILFIICLAIIGGIKGLFFFGILAILFLIIRFILLPLVSFGISPVFLSVIFSLVISLLINFLIHGTSEKFLKSVLSNVISILTVTIFGYIFARLGSYGSLILRDSITINSTEIDIPGFITSSILLSSLGGIINVSIFTFNTFSDVKKSFPKIDFNQLFLKTLKYSRPSVLINFLYIFLIYTGLSLPILITKYNVYSLRFIINSDIVSFYLISVALGGFGIIASNICTCIIAAYKPSQRDLRRKRRIRKP